MTQKTMLALQHLITPELRKKLSNLGILSPNSTAEQSPNSSVPNGVGRLEFDTFAQMQACASSLYANCRAGEHYWDEQAQVWVLFVHWTKVNKEA